MTGPTAFIINGRAGPAFDAGWLHEQRPAIEAIAAGGPITVVEDGGQLRAAVEQALALKCVAVVAGGGDGTLNAVASRLVGGPVAFGVLPLGTLNHFAKDLGIPLDPTAALQTIAAGHRLAVDVGEVNGHHFLNNSSIGLYVDMVRDRERQQTRLGRGKWLAFAWAMLGTLRRYPFMTVTLTVRGQTIAHRTPLVFVGNNAYLTEGLQIGQRDGLQGGVLSVYVTERAGRWRLIELGLRALAGRLRQAKDFRVLLATELHIDTARRRLRVATDGELRRLDTPLRYRIHPRALQVIVPAPVPAPVAAPSPDAAPTPPPA
ncbi:MAG: sphingosine kinase [Burkholderiales bacterium]|nr:sphingosine kinase [Burkholderiales bacterium]MDE2626198.1 sphingosine kinase [Burkholderiales bacterium]